MVGRGGVQRRVVGGQSPLRFRQIPSKSPQSRAKLGITRRGNGENCPKGAGYCPAPGPMSPTPCPQANVIPRDWWDGFIIKGGTGAGPILPAQSRPTPTQLPNTQLLAPASSPSTTCQWYDMEHGKSMRSRVGMIFAVARELQRAGACAPVPLR